MITVVDEVRLNGDGTYTGVLREYDPSLPAELRLSEVRKACPHRHRVGREARECAWRMAKRENAWRAG